MEGSVPNLRPRRRTRISRVARLVGHPRRLRRAVILAFVYLALGVAGMSLSGEWKYGEVPVFFLLAGVAIGAVLVYGPTLLPGVFVGAFALQFLFQVVAGGTIGVLGAGAALIAATGATMQAWLSLLALRKFVPERLRLLDGRSIFAFMAITSALAAVPAGFLILAPSYLGMAMPGSIGIYSLHWWFAQIAGTAMIKPMAAGPSIPNDDRAGGTS